MQIMLDSPACSYHTYLIAKEYQRLDFYWLEPPETHIISLLDVGGMYEDNKKNRSTPVMDTLFYIQRVGHYRLDNQREKSG